MCTKTTRQPWTEFLLLFPTKTYSCSDNEWNYHFLATIHWYSTEIKRRYLLFWVILGLLMNNSKNTRWALWKSTNKVIQFPTIKSIRVRYDCSVRFRLCFFESTTINIEYLLHLRFEHYEFLDFVFSRSLHTWQSLRTSAWALFLFFSILH